MNRPFLRTFLLLPLTLVAVGCSKANPHVHASASAVIPIEETLACERGPIHFKPETEDEKRRIISSFEARNGVVARRSEVDRLGRFVRWTGILREPTAGAPEVSDAEIEASARGFLRKNADLFGIEAAEIDGLVAKNVGVPGVRVAMLELSSRKPVPGYEDLGFVRNIDIVASVFRTGEVAMVTNKGEFLPDFKLCKAPLLTPTDPAVRAHVIGEMLHYGASTGEVVPKGPIEEKDLGPPTLTVFVEQEEPQGTRVALAYSIGVFKQKWTAYVDANTGELLRIVQNFRT